MPQFCVWDSRAVAVAVAVAFAVVIDVGVCVVVVVVDVAAAAAVGDFLHHLDFLDYFCVRTLS